MLWNTSLEHQTCEKMYYALSWDHCQMRRDLEHEQEAEKKKWCYNGWIEFHIWIITRFINNYYLLILGWSYMKDVMFFITLVFPRPQNTLRLKIQQQHLIIFSRRKSKPDSKTISNYLSYLCYSNSGGLKSIRRNSHHARVGDWVYQDWVDEGIGFLAVNLQRKWVVNQRAYVPFDRVTFIND